MNAKNLRKAVEMAKAVQKLLENEKCDVSKDVEEIVNKLDAVIKDIVVSLSPLEKETYDKISKEGKVRIPDGLLENPKMMGALGKLKSRGLVMFVREPERTDAKNITTYKFVKICE